MVPESVSVEALSGEIRNCLSQKGIPHEVDYEDGTITARRGSATVIVKTMKWGEQSLVKLVAPVVLSVDNVSPELTRFLVETNSQLLFGRFSLDTQDNYNAIWLEHVLLGDSLNVDELSIAVDSLAKVADECFDQVWDLTYSG